MSDDNQFLNNMHRIVRDLNKWADEKIASGVPPSQIELDSVEKLREQLAELRLVLAKMKTRRDSK